MRATEPLSEKPTTMCLLISRACAFGASVGIFVFCHLKAGGGPKNLKAISPGSFSVPDILPKKKERSKETNPRRVMKNATNFAVFFFLLLIPSIPSQGLRAQVSGSKTNEPTPPAKEYDDDWPGRRLVICASEKEKKCYQMCKNRRNVCNSGCKIACKNMCCGWKKLGPVLDSPDDNLCDKGCLKSCRGKRRRLGKDDSRSYLGCHKECCHR